MYPAIQLNNLLVTTFKLTNYTQQYEKSIKELYQVDMNQKNQKSENKKKGMKNRTTQQLQDVK